MDLCSGRLIWEAGTTSAKIQYQSRTGSDNAMLKFELLNSYGTSMCICHRTMCLCVPPSPRDSIARMYCRMHARASCAACRRKLHSCSTFEADLCTLSRSQCRKSEPDPVMFSVHHGYVHVHILASSPRIP